MQTVILAGGSGKRVHPLSLTKPKPMFKILGKPLLQHVVETLKEAKQKDFIIVLGQHADQIKNYFSDGSKFGVNIEYVYQQEPLGMANAILAAKNLIEDNFLVVNGDDIFESSLIEKKLRTFDNSNTDLILSCRPIKETWKFGILKLEKDGKVTQIVEKPPIGKEPSNLGVMGAYILPLRIFEYYEKLPVSDMQHELAIQKYIDDKNLVCAVTYYNFFASYKHPWDLFTINEHLMNKYLVEPMIDDEVEISEKVEIEGSVWIEKQTRVLEGAVIKGPCFIGANSLIGNNVLVRNFSSIGENSIVGFSTEITNSIIGENCWFHTNYVGDSIIGDNCSFGAGAVTANFRFDENTIKVNIGDEKIDSNRDKLGAIIADNSKIGVNVTLNPGTKIGPNSIVGPGVFLQGDLEPNKIILIDKKSYLVRDNRIRIFPYKKEELKKRLENDI